MLPLPLAGGPTVTNAGRYAHEDTLADGELVPLPSLEPLAPQGRSH